MERRRFIKNITLGAAAISSLTSMQAKKGDKLTILHTNDFHSHIEPFPDNHSKYPGQGGVSRRMALINQIRATESQVLLLDAGDIFQGTPYFNVHGGEVEMKLYTAMGYDAATMGNHDFDAGMEGFKKQLPHAKFPFLCANYDFSNTVLEGLTNPYQVFQKGSIKVGVFGIVVELDGLVAPTMYGETKYLNPIEIASDTAKTLRDEEKCDLVICLSHLGYFAKLNEWCDTKLANETENIDLIIGGHTHTFMDKPEVHKNRAGKTVLINQAGWAGLVLGRVDFTFDKRKDEMVWSTPQFGWTNHNIG